MKKIIISIVSIIAGVILAITLVFVFHDKKTDIYIESSYNDVKLSLGKTKVKDINNTRSSFYDKQREYFMSDPYEFYESNIKTSEYYNSKLTFYTENNKIYGYLIKDEVSFKYEVKDDEICLSTMAMEYNGNETYGMILCDIGDFITSQNQETKYSAFLSQWFIFSKPSILKYDDIIELYKCMNQDMVKIEDDAIYLKGYDISMNLSSDYIVKIINVDGIGYGYAIEA